MRYCVYEKEIEDIEKLSSNEINNLNEIINFLTPEIIYEKIGPWAEENSTGWEIIPTGSKNEYDCCTVIFHSNDETNYCFIYKEKNEYKMMVLPYHHY